MESASLDDFTTDSAPAAGEAPPVSDAPAESLPSHDAPPAELPDDAEPDSTTGEPQSDAAPVQVASDRNPDGTFKPKAKEAYKRVQKVTWEREEAKREAAELRARLEALEARQHTPAPAAPTPQATPDGDPEPQEADFEVYGDYVKKISEWQARQVFKAQQQQWQAQAQTASSEQFHAQRAQQFATRLQTATQADPTFLQTIHPAVLALRPSSSLQPGERATAMHAVADALIDSEVPDALMRHWTEHFDDDFRRLLTLHPIQVIREVGKLEARLGTAPAGSVPSSPVLSSAKPPIKPVGSAPAIGDSGPLGENASFDDHLRDYAKRTKAPLPTRRR